MNETLRHYVEYVALGIEIAGILTMVFGALLA
ncbi:MAG TPA: DUF1622 domain-containing protein, partial [Salinimicrobium catena]|nr:DUF1622 domain-containing protein [Salinimicrobium catena]